MAEFTVGERIEQQYRKYDGTPHWHFDTAYIGSDEHGIWLGGVPGDVFERPGRRFLADAYYVTLIPEDRFVATFNSRSDAVRSEIYVDVMSMPEWQGRRVEAIDLDLDVVRRFTGEVRILDEDEFVDHQLAFGYPSELISSVRGTADELYSAVLAGREPFGQVGFAWLERCRDLLSGD